MLQQQLLPRLCLKVRECEGMKNNHCGRMVLGNPIYALKTTTTTTTNNNNNNNNTTTTIDRSLPDESSETVWKAQIKPDLDAHAR